MFWSSGLSSSTEPTTITIQSTFAVIVLWGIHDDPQSNDLSTIVVYCKVCKMSWSSGLSSSTKSTKITIACTLRFTVFGTPRCYQKIFWKVVQHCKVCKMFWSSGLSRSTESTIIVVQSTLIYYICCYSGCVTECKKKSYYGCLRSTKSTRISFSVCSWFVSLWPSSLWASQTALSAWKLLKILIRGYRCCL